MGQYQVVMRGKQDALMFVRGVRGKGKGEEVMHD